MKKIVCILLFAFLLTGCSVNYNLNINANSNISESFNFSIDKTKVTKDDLNTIGSFNDDENGFYADRIKYTDKNNKLYFTGSSEYDSIDDFLRFSLYNSLFDFEIHSTYSGTEQTISVTNFGTLLSSNIFSNKIDKINININVPYLVTDHNGKKVDDNTYSWEITDATDNISLTFDQTLFPEKEKKLSFNFSEYAVALGITGGILFTIAIIFYLRLKYLNKKNNRI